MVRDLPVLIKHVGRGARLAKDLPRDEAAQMMRAMLDGEADPVQIGGFLIAQRMKSESADELAGFVDALRAAAAPFAAPADPARPLVDVDLHGDGRAGRPSVTLAAACLAASQDVRILIRGSFGGRFARHDLDEVFATLGVRATAPAATSARALADAGVAVLDLAVLSPRAAELLALRERLGVRTCINTVLKLFDPALARRQLIGIFHGPYHAPVAGAARALGTLRAAVVQAPGGVPEPSPDRPTRITLVDADAPPADPTALAPAGSDAPPVVETAAELAALLEAIIIRPAQAPPGAVRATLLAAALMLWAAGRAPAPTDADTLARLHTALHAGRAADAWHVMRTCYSV